jgi:Immediate early response protein (IER)
MTFIMATEAQRLISISLAKIAASRCVRGGVSLHKNLLVATVLQKARYIFMEEAFHMVHGTYLNQANSKFIQQLRDQEHLDHELQHHDKDYDDDDDDASATALSMNDSELDLFSSSMDSSDSLSFLSEPPSKEPLSKHNCSSTITATTTTTTIAKESNPSLASTSTDLIYLDLDVNRVKPQDEQSANNSISGHKRRLSDDDETEEAILSILPKSKQIKYNNNNEEPLGEEPSSPLTSCSASDITTDNCLSLDFLSNDLTSGSPTHTAVREIMTMAPLDMSSNSTSTSTSASSSSSIDRITSLVSIFNFGNLQRTVSQPDLCSSSSHSTHHTSVDNSCCNLSTQRQIAMTV